MASVTGNIYADDAATITLGQPETETPTISSAYQAWAELFCMALIPPIEAQ